MQKNRETLKRRIIAFAIILIFTASNSTAQNNYDLKQFGEETVEFIKAPLSWDAGDFLTLGVIAAGTYALMYADQDINQMMRKDTSFAKSFPMEFGRYWGEPVTSVVSSAALLIHGYATNDETTKKIGFEIGQSFLYTIAVTEVLKITIGRARPYTGNNPFTFDMFSFRESNWSMPSGHTSIAFSLSTVLAANTNSTFLKILAFTPAFITAVSRVYQNHHWTSDVFLGAFVGYFIGKFVTDLHQENEKNPTTLPPPLLSITLQF